MKVKWVDTWITTEERATNIAKELLSRKPSIRKDAFHTYLINYYGAFEHENANYLWKKLKGIL